MQSNVNFLNILWHSVGILWEVFAQMRCDFLSPRSEVGDLFVSMVKSGQGLICSQCADLSPFDIQRGLLLMPCE